MVWKSTTTVIVRYDVAPAGNSSRPCGNMSTGDGEGNGGNMEGRLDSMSGRLRVLVVLAAMAVLAGSGTAGAAPRPYGDVQVLAQVPAPPGFPEGIAVFGSLVWVSGPATFGTAGQGPSKVLLYHASSGRLLRTFDIQGEDLTQEHANSSVAVDGLGRAYVLNTQLGVVRISVNGKQEQYSTPFPDLPFNGPPIPNDLVFDDAGNLYVTDSFQATIWRVPPGGGTPQIWFQDPRLATPSFGPNGIRIDPTGTVLYFTMTEDMDHRSLVYRVPLANPTAATLEEFYDYAGDVPDGIAFGQTGLLYVTLATPFASGISILSPSGVEVDRLGNPPGSPTFPYDSPANLAFTGKGNVLAINHAVFTGDEDHFAILDVWVADKGLPLERPVIR